MSEDKLIYSAAPQRPERKIKLDIRDYSAATSDSADKARLQSELATSKSTGYFTNFMNLLPNPEPLLYENGNRYTIYDEILNDPFTHGLITARMSGSLSYEWEIIRNKANKPEINLLQYNLEKIFDSDLWKDILMAYSFGCQYLEVMWDTSGSNWVADKIIAKPHEVFTWDNEGILKLLTNENAIEGEEVPEFKFLTPRNNALRPSFNKYYGSSLLAKGYWNCFVRKYEIDFMSAFSEDFGFPKVYGKVNLEMAQKLQSDLNLDISQLLTDVNTKLQNLRQNGTFAFYDGIEVAQLNATNTGQMNIFTDAIHVTKQLDSVLYLGHEGAAMSTPGELGGKENALYASHNLVDAGNRLIESTINRYISWVHYLNFNNANVPKIRLFQKDDDEKYNKRADVDLKLTQMGVKLNEDYFEDAYNLDKKYFTLQEPSPSTDPESTPQAQSYESMFLNTLEQIHLKHPELSNSEAMEAAEMICSKSEQ